MKNIFPIFLFHLTVLNIQYSIAQNGALKNNVRESKTYSVSKTGDSILIQFERYNRKNQLLEKVSYNNDGSPAHSIINQYDKQSLLTATAEYDGSNTLHGKKIYKYNDKNLLAEEVRFEKEDEWEYKISYAYDIAGNKISEVKTGENGTMMRKKTFSYDISGNLTEERNYDSKDVLNIWYARKYDDKKNLTEEIRYLADKEQWKFIFTFTSANFKKSETHIYPFEKSNSSVVWQYNDSNQLTEEITYNFRNEVTQKLSLSYLNGKPVIEEKNNSRTVYEYDSIGIKMKEVTFFNRAMTSEKLYDTKGNVFRWNHFSNRTLSFSEIFFYDSSQTRLIKSTKVDGINKTLEENEYRYDAEGNMTDEQNKGEDGRFVFRKVILYSYYEHSAN